MAKGDKQREFDELVAAGMDPKEAARVAGFTRPAQALKRLAARNAPRSFDAMATAIGTPNTAADAPPTDDLELSRKALRAVLAFGDPKFHPAAAKALADMAPPPTKDSGPPCVVVFRGREPAPGAVVLPSDVDPGDLLEALRLLRAGRLATA